MKFPNFFKQFFKENHRFGTMERTWYSDHIRRQRTYCSSSLQKFQHYTNLNSCHLLTNTSLLYPYLLSNQNQTDPYIIVSLLVDLEGVEPSSLTLSWYYQQVVLCGSRGNRTHAQWLTAICSTFELYSHIFQRTILLFMKIIFSKNNNYYFERNAGIEPTASNWNVRILPSELIPQILSQNLELLTREKITDKSPQSLVF